MIKKCLVYINSSKNNTIFTVTNIFGGVLYWTSSGRNGFKNSKKSTSYASQVSSLKIKKFIKINNFNLVSILVKGFGIGRDNAIKYLNSSCYFVDSIEDITPIIHNGCRIKKPRRV